jgi:hypothetical protein
VTPFGSVIFSVISKKKNVMIGISREKEIDNPQE